MNRSSLALLSVALVGATIASQAMAQDVDEQRLDVMDSRIEALARQTGAIANQERRLRGLEDAVRAVNGQVEENRHLLEQLHSELKRLEDLLATSQIPPIADPPVSEERTEPHVGAPPIVNPTAPAPVQDTPTDPGVTQLSDEETSYKKAYELLSNADYAGAEAAFLDFIKKYPNSTLTDNAYYWLGESHYVREQYEDAAARFARGFQMAPDSQKAPDMLLKLGMSLTVLSNFEDACATFERLVQDYPDALERMRPRVDRARARARCT